MFEKMRSNLVRRLGALIERFEAINVRANDGYQDAHFAARMGISDGHLAAVLSEIAVKSMEQGDLCAQAIGSLIQDRALPLMFRRGTSKAEQFASQCEAILAEIDAGRQWGKGIFKEKYGSMGIGQ